MGAPQLTLALLGAGCFSLATWLGPEFDRMSPRREQGFMANFLGEGRKLFAEKLFIRSDVYFHSGYYPSIFDQAKGKKENHLVETAGAHDSSGPAHGQSGHVHHDDEEEDFLGPPTDVMDRFARHFFVSQHSHLTEKGSNAPKEILPWIKLAAELDPNKIESYTVGAFWLRQLNKNAEAEQFLREGLRRNPRSYELMLELGRGYFEEGDYSRARNVLEMAMQRWREQENPKPLEQQNRFSAQLIVDYLARLEDRTGHREATLNWLSILKKVSPRKRLRLSRRGIQNRASRTGL